MSQALLGNPMSFTKAPSTANFFKQTPEGEGNQGTQQQAAPVVNPQPQGAPLPPQNPPVIDPTLIPAPREQYRNPILPPPVSTQTPSPEAPAPQPAQEVPTTAPQPETQPAPVAAFSQQDYALQQQLAQERQYYAQQQQQMQAALQQQQQQLAQYEQMRAELEQYKQREELWQKLSSDEAFAGMETVAPDDARRIIQMAAEVTRPDLKQTQEAILKQQQDMAAQQEALRQDLYKVQVQRVAQDILSQHPDFYSLYSRPDFKAFMSERDGYNSKTREQIATEEFYAGNPAYVIDLLNRFKGTLPNTQNIQQVPPVQVASSAATPAQPMTQPQFTLSELNSLMQTRRITPEQYRAELNKLRQAAQQATQG
ncbi:MAG: hypothetical protein HDQ88_09535 [Clostridia bacterium]|nr:hypothetical protein [Clostridia bacterium]